MCVTLISDTNQKEKKKQKRGNEGGKIKMKHSFKLGGFFFLAFFFFFFEEKMKCNETKNKNEDEIYYKKNIHTHMILHFLFLLFFSK